MSETNCHIPPNVGLFSETANVYMQRRTVRKLLEQDIEKNPLTAFVRVTPKVFGLKGVHEPMVPVAVPASGDRHDPIVTDDDDAPSPSVAPVSLEQQQQQQQQQQQPEQEEQAPTTPQPSAPVVLGDYFEAKAEPSPLQKLLTLLKPSPHINIDPDRER